MPELPEVETVKRQLEPEILTKTITAIQLFWHKTLERPDLATFQGSVLGRPITELRRRGKYLILCLNHGYLVFHLRMTGRMYTCQNPKGKDPWVRFSLQLDQNQYLCFSDTRKFGRVFFDDSLHTLETKLGPEPLDLKPKDWEKLFSNQSQGLKAFLLNQKKLAGLGNIYTDEALFMSHLHPLRSAGSLSEKRARSLGKNIKSILTKAINYEGATISWYRKPDGTQGESQKHFAVYGKAGSPCPTCGHSLQKTKVCQRTTCFCPQCQT